MLEKGLFLIKMSKKSKNKSCINGVYIIVNTKNLIIIIIIIKYINDIYIINNINNYNNNNNNNLI
jgi:hypothetical protein